MTRPTPPGRWTPVYDRMFQPDHELAGDPACRRWAWADLCHMAQYEDGNRIVSGTLVPLKRGELLASVRFLAERWKWSRGKVTRFLDLLMNAAVRKIETARETPVGTVYRVVSYDTYANPRDSKRDTNGANNGTGTGQGRDKEQQVPAGNSSTTTTSKEGRASRSRAVQIPDSWEPNEGHVEIAAELDLDVSREAVRFRDHAKSTGRTLKDWDAGFRNWLRKAPEFKGRSGQAENGKAKKKAGVNDLWDRTGTDA